MTFDQISFHRKQMLAFEEAQKEGIAALAVRRGQADADLASVEAKLSRDTVTTEEGARLEAELAILQAQRTNEIGTAHADGRKANTAKTDKAIKAKEDEIAAYRERLEAAQAARPILEERLAAARKRHASDVATINEEMVTNKDATAREKHALADALESYARLVRQSASADEMVANRFRPADRRNDETGWHASAEAAADNSAARTRRDAELTRLASIGLPENRARYEQIPVAASVRCVDVNAHLSPSVIGGMLDSGPYTGAGVFSANGQRIG
jgi:hypothetical protein